MAICDAGSDQFYLQGYFRRLNRSQLLFLAGIEIPRLNWIKRVFFLRGYRNSLAVLYRVERFPSADTYRTRQFYAGNATR